MGHRPKLYQIFDTLSEEELSSCHHYLRQKWNKGSQIYNLSEYIFRKNRPFPQLDEIKHKLFSTLSNKQISNKLLIIKKAVEEWLITKQQSNNLILQQYDLYLSYHDRGLFNDAAKQWEKVKHYCEKHKDYDIQCYWYLHRLYHSLYYSHSPEKNKDPKTLIEKSNNYQETHRLLTHKQYALEEIIINTYYSYDDLVFDHSINAPSDNTISTIIDILYQLIKTQEISSIEYDHMMSYLRYGRTMNIGEIYVIILIHFIQQKLILLKKNGLYTDDDLIELYDLGLTTKSFMYRGYISARRFGNIVNAACAMQKTTWLRNMVSRYSTHLHPDDALEVLQMSKAQIAVAEEKYSEAVEIINGFQWTMSDHKLRYRSLLCICYLEEKEFTLLETFINSFRAYLSNNSDNLTKIAIEGAKGYLTIIRMFCNAKPINEIARTYSSLTYVSNRVWIERKLKS